MNPTIRNFTVSDIAGLAITTLSSYGVSGGFDYESRGFPLPFLYAFYAPSYTFSPISFAIAFFLWVLLTCGMISVIGHVRRGGAKGGKTESISEVDVEETPSVQQASPRQVAA